MRAVDLIVKHFPHQWQHRQTGEIQSPVYVSPLEVIAIGDNSAWLGRAGHFVLEFEPIEEQEQHASV
jgi:hypothetical protein